jgi:hypothetical protein
MSELDDNHSRGPVPWHRRVAQVTAGLAVAVAVWWTGETLSHLPGPPVVPIGDRLIVELEPTPSSTTSTTPPQPTISVEPPAPPPEVTPPITRQPLPDDDDGGDDDG